MQRWAQIMLITPAGVATLGSLTQRDQSGCMGVLSTKMMGNTFKFCWLVRSTRKNERKKENAEEANDDDNEEQHEAERMTKTVHYAYWKISWSVWKCAMIQRFHSAFLFFLLLMLLKFSFIFFSRGCNHTFPLLVPLPTFESLLWMWYLLWLSITRSYCQLICNYLS